MFLLLCCSLKCRASRLCSESELGLRTILQDPLLVYAQWSHMVSQVLESSADVTDFSYISMLVQNIEVKFSALTFLLILHKTHSWCTDSSHTLKHISMLSLNDESGSFWRSLGERWGSYPHRILSTPLPPVHSSSCPLWSTPPLVHYCPLLLLLSTPVHYSCQLLSIPPPVYPSCPLQSTTLPVHPLFEYICVCVIFQAMSSSCL